MQTTTIVRLTAATALLATACTTHPEASSQQTPSPDALALLLDGEPITIDVEPNANLFAAGFATYRWNGTELVETRGIPEDADCYQHGSSTEGIAAIHSCASDRSDLSGVLFRADGLYDLRYESGRVVAERARGRAGSCGFDHVAARSDDVPELEGAVELDDFRTTRLALEDPRPRFIETIVVQDAGWYAAEDAGLAVADPIMTAHAMAALYDGQTFAQRTIPILTGVIETNGQNPWGDPANGGRVNSFPYLDTFNGWLESNRTTLPRFDGAALMTGYDMGSTIGLAIFEGSCGSSSSGALVYSIGSVAYGAMTMAHEFGHLVGMDHDGISAQCPEDQYIMTPEYYEEGPFPQDFSPCSIADADVFLGRAVARCINQESGPTFPEPRCGDGKIEGDEQCDCGPDGCEGRDPCCDGDTCTLSAGASCSVFDGCCDPDTCAPYAPTAQVVCRSERSECDIAETCDGTASCPADRVVVTGTACSDGNGWTGACYVGECVSRGGACEVLAEYYVLDTPPYAPMCGVDVGCGPMECLSSGQCVVTEDPPPDGIACGPGRQCLDSQCVPSDSLAGADGCGDPDQDVDGDGTADCYDNCPLDPSTTTAPCGEPSTGEENNTTTTNNGNTNSMMDPTDDESPDGPDSGDSVIIIEQPSDDGCSTVRGVGSFGLIVGVLFGLGRRRR